MTYIEFFDKTASENLCACLTFVPERVIFLGEDAQLMQQHLAAYQRIFAHRGYEIQCLCKTVSQSNLRQAVALLTQIVEQYDDCVFDITGGEEILTFALGMVCARYPEKQIQIHKLHLGSDSVCAYQTDGTTRHYPVPRLTVAENIRMYGGEVAYGTPTMEKTAVWQMDEAFRCDLELLWQACKEDVRLWNTQVGILGAIESVGQVSGNGLTTRAQRQELAKHPLFRKTRYQRAGHLLGFLLTNGLLAQFRETEDAVVVSYKNQQVKKCLTKAGLALEMKVYNTAREAVDDAGQLVYHDVQNGVVIDWDGQISQGFQTENEIDVLMMHRMVPVFVSCKNGIVNVEELYKLNTVAERFGGPYAKKVLVATALGHMGNGGQHLRQRAADMKIEILENVQALTEAEFAQAIQNLWKNG